MYRFHNKQVDTAIFLQLQDLAINLANHSKFTFEFNYGAFVDIVDHTITASRFWDTTESESKIAGYKTDIYLRTIGTLHHTTIPALQSYLETIEDASLPKFAAQLFTLLEDIRIEEIVKKIRPGTKTAFSLRREYYKHYFTSQLATNVTRSYPLDELFCLIYLLLHAEEPDPIFPRANEEQLMQLDDLKPTLYSVFEANNTNDITNIAEKITFRLAANYDDTLNEYFVLPIVHVEKFSRNTLFDELTRTDPLVNDDMEIVDPDKADYIDEKFSTWHRENANEDRQQTFLQYELDQGTNTSLIGDGARETENGDQAMAQLQGTSGKSEQNDYSKLDLVDKQTATEASDINSFLYGEVNQHAVKIINKATAPTPEDIANYDQLVRTIEPYKRKLAKTIEKTIEHKKNEPRKDLLYGRLSKKLLPIVIDNDRRIFYKKNDDSKQMDAVFSLLIDCSASMQGKMEETKKGIILFHEVLKQLHIPHSITGFWEDANEVKQNYQPNYFHVIHSFSDSLYQNNGPKILQLEPEEDNRDGFSIRVATQELQARSEKHKFLLVFSDGEPAAAGYDQNGIVDTNEAVTEARRKGIDVIGMFLANGEIDEHEQRLMKNIYGIEHVLIPAVSELPEHFAPLLKKLLLRAI